MKYVPNKQQILIDKLANNKEWDLFVTLTFSKKYDDEYISKTLRQFFICVERSCFGRKAKSKRIYRLPTIEHTFEASHLHVMIKKPENYKYDEFRDLLIKKWMKMYGCGRANLNKKNSHKKWYLKINDSKKDRKKVLNYITKNVDKNFNGLDINNIFI